MHSNPSLYPEWDLKEIVNVNLLWRPPTPSTTSGQVLLRLNVLTDPPPLLTFIRKFHKWRKATGKCHHAIWFTNRRVQRWLGLGYFFPLQHGGKKYCFSVSDHCYLPLVSPARNCRAWTTKSDQHEAEENHALMELAGDDCHIWTFSSNWGVKLMVLNSLQGCYKI